MDKITIEDSSRKISIETKNQEDIEEITSLINTLLKPALIGMGWSKKFVDRIQYVELVSEHVVSED
jgi:hypothetical protein